MLKEKGMDIYYSENQSMGEGTAGGGRIRADITSFLFARFGRRKTGNNQRGWKNRAGKILSSQKDRNYFFWNDTGSGASRSPPDKADDWRFRILCIACAGSA